MRPSLLFEALKFCVKNREPVLIKGPPGSGKTDLGNDVAEALTQKLIITHPVVSNPTDYKGLPFPSADRKEAIFLPFGDLLSLIKADSPTMFFIDDLGQAPAAVQASLMQLLLARRINEHKISDEVTFIAATNRRQDKGAVQGILEPVKSRFATILELEVNVDDWAEWAIRHIMPPILIAFIRFRPDLLYQFKPTADITNTPVPRTVASIGRMVNNGIMETAKKVDDNFLKNLDLYKVIDGAATKEGLGVTLIYEMLAGAAGEGFATEFISFLKMYQHLPSISSIINNPEGIGISNDISQHYAICTALANKTDKRNFGKIIQYIERLSTEFQYLYFKDIGKAKRSLITSTKEFADWNIRHAPTIL